MDNNEEKRSNLNPDEKSAKSDIPLWLQGLEDQNQNDTKPTESSELKEDNWIKEVENSPSNKDDQYLIGEQGFKAQKETNETIQGDKTGEVHTHSWDYQSNDSEKQISDEGFMDLSDSNLGENMELGSPKYDEDLLSEDELPQWLMDMIDEDVPSEIEDSLGHPEVIDEPWGTAVLPKIPPKSESIEITQEIPVSEYMDDEETVSFLVNEIETEHINHVSEEIFPHYAEEHFEPELTNFEDQTKADLSLIEEIVLEPSKTAAEAIPESFSDELPNTLIFAKKLLDNGEFESALDIIQSHLVETSYFEEVEKWLSESFDKSEHIPHERLKTLGVILHKRGKLLKTFAAYTRAVESFLLNKPVEDEIN